MTTALIPAHKSTAPIVPDSLKSMSVIQSGVCQFCGRDYLCEESIPAHCSADDCPSNTDLVAFMRADRGGEVEYFCVEGRDEDDFFAVFPESLSAWSVSFTDHASCKKYLEFMVNGLLQWQELGDIPVDEDDNIDCDFLHFKKGASKIDIWLWFESEFSASVVEHFMPNSDSDIAWYKEPVGCRSHSLDPSKLKDLALC